MKTLNNVKIGESAVVKAINCEGSLRQHFLDMGLIPGTEITVVKYAPMGDPIELLIHGYKLTLRLADAEKIETEPAENKKQSKEESAAEKAAQAAAPEKEDSAEPAEEDPFDSIFKIFNSK